MALSDSVTKRQAEVTVGSQQQQLSMQSLRVLQMTHRLLASGDACVTHAKSGCVCCSLADAVETCTSRPCWHATLRSEDTLGLRRLCSAPVYHGTLVKRQGCMLPTTMRSSVPSKGNVPLLSSSPATSADGPG